MRGITNAMLARMREDVETDLMPDTMTILSKTETGDGAGGYSEAWGTATAGIACRLDPIRPRGERLSAGAIQEYTSWMLTYPYDTALTTDHRVEIGGVQYNVTSINGGSWLVAGRAVLERV